uniref:Uncharacterized protein n=1 Tax=Branchiostoma floridae TaxID=7739 RepID=C3ZY54_BRAFL|eukprot:XP_002586525.1 hypothetical protein BRAFLDRAFT_106425 [Branchiostoma floridae]
MAEELPSDVVPSQPTNDPFETSCMKQAAITVSPGSEIWETTFRSCDRHGDSSTLNAYDENNDSDHHLNPSEYSTSENELEKVVSGHNTGISSTDGYDWNMRDIQHPLRALYQNPTTCERDALNPDMTYLQNARNMRSIQHPPRALYQNPTCERDALNPDMTYLQNARNMQDTQHPPRALYQNPTCERDALNPDMTYSQNAVISPNPVYPPIPINAIGHLEHLHNDRNPNQIYEPDVRTDPSDGNPSIESFTVTYQERHDNDNNEPSGAATENIEMNDVEHDAAEEATAVSCIRPNPISRPANRDLYIQPYAVRYQEQGGSKTLKCGGTPYAVRYQEDNEDNIVDAYGDRVTHHTTPDDVDVIVTPFAVTHSSQYGMTGVTRRDVPMTNTDIPDSIREDINIQQIRQNTRALHRQDLCSITNAGGLNPNMTYAPKAPQQAARADPNLKLYSKHGPATNDNLSYCNGVYDFHRDDFHRNDFYRNDFHRNDFHKNDFYSKNFDSNDFYADYFFLNYCCQRVIFHNNFYVNVKDVLLPNDDSL